MDNNNLYKDKFLGRKIKEGRKIIGAWQEMLKDVGTPEICSISYCFLS